MLIWNPPKDVRETQSFNEVWLEVQERFIQDHQDIEEAFKFAWIKRTQLSVWRSPRKGWSKTYVLALSDQDKSFISTMMHLVKVWDVSLYKKKSSVLFIKSTKEVWVGLPNILCGVIHCKAWRYYLL